MTSPQPGSPPAVGLIGALRSVVFALLFLSGSVLLAFLIPVALRRPLASIRWVCDRWSNWQRWCVTHVLGVKVVVEGELPKGGVLVAMKHESMFEAVDLPTLLDFPVVFAKVELMKLPFWGRAGFAYGLVPVERDQGAKAMRVMMQAGRAFAASGRPLVIFPEGTRVRHGQTPALQAGFAGLYKLLNLPVVPIAVNSGPLLRSFWKRRGTVTYRVGETIPAGLPREEAEARVHAAINVLNGV